MYRIVAVGEKDLILAFRGAGADLETVTSEVELEEVLTKLSKDSSVALVLVTESIAAEGMEVIEERGPTLLVEGLTLITGQIPRLTTFENGMPPMHAEVSGEWQPDPWIHDDQAIVINVREKGLVVLTGCGHAGLINTLQYARRITGVSEIYAVMGGFHLTGRIFEPIIPPTIQALKELSPNVIVPQHCTGWRATHDIAREFPEAFVASSVGTQFIL